jgi:Ribosomal protein L9, N-terminal domain
MSLKFALSFPRHLRSVSLVWNRQPGPLHQRHSLNLCRRSMGHTVRIIVTQDVSDGKLYQGDIATVRAGYARNFLIPQKKAVYATRQNFLKLSMTDPELESADERRFRMEREMQAGDDKDLKAADLLRTYFRNKTVSFPNSNAPSRFIFSLLSAKTYIFCPLLFFSCPLLY